ncbi:MAG: hypothetical protein ACLVKA_04000 [Collinsella aerofaciens]
MSDFRHHGHRDGRRQAGRVLDRDGNVEDIRPILVVDSVAAAAGGFMGVSSITTFVESTSGPPTVAARASPPSPPACCSFSPFFSPSSPSFQRRYLVVLWSTSVTS